MSAIQAELPTRESENASKDTLTKWTDDRIRWDDETLLKTPENDEDAAEDPFAAPDNPEVFSFTFHPPEGDEIIIELDGYDEESDHIWQSTGLTVWKAAQFLGDYQCQSQHSGRILELGAGLGLNGMLAHCLDPTATVIITDGDSNVLEFLQKNLEKNKLNDNVSCRQLLWGGDTCEKLLKVEDSFDYIIASDIVYAASIIKPLWETVDTLLTPNGVFVLAFAKRKVPVAILDVLDAGVGFESTCVRQDGDEIFVYEFRRASTDA